MTSVLQVGAPVEAVLELVEAESGLTFPRDRRGYAAHCLARLLDSTEVPSLDRLLARMVDEPELKAQVIGALTVGESYFFRDPDQLGLLFGELVPERLRARSDAGAVRVWSAGCANGEEAYSIAMLAERNGYLDQCVVVGTDVSDEVLRRARSGRFRSWSLRGVSDEVRATHFVRAGSDWRLAERFRGRAAFFRHNLVCDPLPALPLGLWDLDLILCRNVLIHLSEQAGNRVIDRLASVLSPGGLLVLGASDPMIERHPLLKPVEGATAVYAKTGPTLWPNRPRDAGTEETAAPRAVVRQLWAKGKVALARTRCRAAAEASPLDPELHALACEMALAANDLPDALTSVRRGLFLDRQAPRLHYLEGLVLGHLGRPDAALKSFQNAEALLARMEPGDVVAYTDGASVGNVRLKCVLARHALRTDPSGGPKP